MNKSDTTSRCITTVIAMAGTPFACADVGDQLFKLLPADGAELDRFGVSVATTDSIAVVGAYWDDDNGDYSGSAYLFDVTTGEQLTKLLPEDGDAFDNFGTGVAISGTIAAVGAPGDGGSGSVYLFDTLTGEQTSKLVPDDDAAFADWFGRSVAISGTTVIVGADGDDDNGQESGSAYLFDAATGEQISKLFPDDGSEYDYFGYSVSISGDIAIVGAHVASAAYLFDVSTGAQLAKLAPDGDVVYDWFGRSVAINGTTAVVGAPQDDDNGSDSGSAYLFDAMTGMQIAKLLPDDGAAGDFFGHTVAISGTTVIGGAYLDSDNAAFSGSAYLFDATTGEFVVKLLPDDGAANDFFGWSVAISGGTAIVGMRNDDDNGESSGSAYLFDADRPLCPADLDGDGSVNVVDLLQVLTSWAGADGDVDGDGTTDVLDLVAVINAWGDCP